MNPIKLIRAIGSVSVASTLAVSAFGQTNTFPTSGNVGIGTSTPQSALEVRGVTLAGDNSNASGGSLAFGITYDGGNIINTIGSQYSSGSTILGWAVKPKTGSTGFVSSAGNANFARGALLLNDSLVFANAAAQTVAIGGDVAMTERFRITSDGNVGIGTTSPSGKLHISSNAGYALISQGSYSSIREIAGIHGITFYPNNGGYNQIYSDYHSGSSALPLSFGAYPVVNALTILPSGSIGIGTTNPGSYKLAVNGTIRAKEVIVDTGWSDYVFAPDYKLAPLSEVETHIKENGHLPGIPSAKEVAEHGVSMGEMQSKLLAKIEELTLHQIEQEKWMKAQEQRIETLEAENKSLRTR